MAVGAGSVWVLGDFLDRRVWRLDPRSGAIQATIALRFPPQSILICEGAEEGFKFFFDLIGAGEGLGDFLSQQLAISAAKSMDCDTDGAFGHG